MCTEQAIWKGVASKPDSLRRIIFYIMNFTAKTYSEFSVIGDMNKLQNTLQTGNSLFQFESPIAKIFWDDSMNSLTNFTLKC